MRALFIAVKTLSPIGSTPNFWVKVSKHLYEEFRIVRKDNACKNIWLRDGSYDNRFDERTGEFVTTTAETEALKRSKQKNKAPRTTKKRSTTSKSKRQGLPKAKPKSAPKALAPKVKTPEAEDSEAETSEAEVSEVEPAPVEDSQIEEPIADASKAKKRASPEPEPEDAPQSKRLRGVAGDHEGDDSAPAAETVELFSDDGTENGVVATVPVDVAVGSGGFTLDNLRRQAAVDIESALLEHRKAAKLELERAEMEAERAYDRAASLADL